MAMWDASLWRQLEGVLAVSAAKVVGPTLVNCVSRSVYVHALCYGPKLHS